jgi:two-component system, cell cycle sensor histidine kinase and response regulator CckA
MEGLAVQVLDALPDAVATIDATGVVRYANARAHAVLGAAHGSLVGRDAETLLPERLRAAYRVQRERFTAQPSERPRTAVTLLRDDGTERDVDLTVAVTRSGAEVLATVSATDGPAGRLDARRMRTQKLASVGRLAVSLAHEFNNTLTGISAHAHLALSRTSPGDPAHEDLRQIVRATDRAGRLIAQLQAVSRGEQVAFESVDVNQCVRDVGRLLEVVAGESIEVELRLHPRLADVRAQLGAVEQVLLHLAMNARDAMAAGGGRLVIATDSQDGFVALSVTDTGTGMDAATARRAFDPAFTTKPGDDASGLGLTIVDATVRRLGGQVRLDSALGRGTTVRILLPEAAETDPFRDGMAAGTAGTLLIVEDEDTLRAVVERILVDEGYTVLSAASGEEALEVAAAAATPVDLLVSDVVLGGMSGPELVTALRGRSPGLKVLLTSGYAGMSIGPVDDFLPKPFSPFELARRIRGILRP